MIYTGICENQKALRMAYAISSNVFTSEREMFGKVFDEDCNIVLLTDEFIATVLRWSTVDSLIREIKKIRRGLKFVIVGEWIEVDTSEAYILRKSWGAATQILHEVEQVCINPLPIKKLESNKIVEKLRYNLASPDFLVDYILFNPEVVLPELKRLVEEAYKDIDSLNRMHSELDTIILENAHLHATLTELEEERERMLRYMESLHYRYDSLVSKINRQYSIPYNDFNLEGFDITMNKYDKILVVKELTRVHFIDSLLYYVQRVLSTVNAVPTRFCVIEKEYSYMSARLYPNHIAHNRLTYNQLKTADICVVGFQQDIIDSILQNASKSKYLLLLDRSGHDFVPVRGDRVKVLYTLSDLADNRHFGVPADLIISYNTDNFTIPVIEGFEQMSDPEKVAAYSSLEITKAIVSAIEGRD